MTPYSFRNRVNRLNQSTQKGGSSVSGKRILVQIPTVTEPQEIIFATTPPLPLPLTITITDSGSVSANGIFISTDSTQTRWNKIVNGRNPLVINNSTITLAKNTSLSGWQINRFGVGGTVYYRVTGLNPFPNIPPLSGWFSTNTLFDPPPILQYETLEGQNLAFSVMLSTSPALTGYEVRKTANSVYEFYYEA